MEGRLSTAGTMHLDFVRTAGVLQILLYCLGPHRLRRRIVHTLEDVVFSAGLDSRLFETCG